MARLSPEQLAADLKKGLAPIYLISGDETLLVQECCDSIRQAAAEAGFQDRELYHADRGFDWNQLHHASQSLSLFSSRKIIELRLSGKLDDSGRKALLEYAESPATDTLLLIVAPKFERTAQSAKWFKALEAASRHIQIWPISPHQLPGWIMQRARNLGLRLEKDAVDVLASRVEGNLLAAAQELEKLRLLYDGQQSVNAELMAQAVADSARYDVFGLVDKALLGDAPAAVKMLQGLKAEGTDVLPVLWALSREARTLLQMREALDAGKSFTAAARQAGVWEKRQGLIKGALARLSQPGLLSLLRKAALVDRAAKGMSDSDPWAICLDLTLSLAGTRALDRYSETLLLRR